jgi:hypothetical protein
LLQKLTLEANIGKLKYGDDEATKQQVGTVAGLLKKATSPMPGVEKDKDDYYRLFLEVAFGITSAKELSKSEAAATINWMMWARGEGFNAARDTKPFMSDLAEKEMWQAVKKFLADRNDLRRLDF